MKKFNLNLSINVRRSLFGLFSLAVCFLGAFFIVGVTALTGQTVDTTGLADNDAFDGDSPVINNLVGIYEVLIMSLTMIWGIIAKATGLKAKVPNFVFVVVAGGVVIVGIFVSFGWAKGIPAAVAVLTSMGIFDILRGGAKAAGLNKA